MSEEEKKANEALLFDDVVQFLIDKKIDSDCPQCGEGGTAIICEDDQVYASVYPIHPFMRVGNNLTDTNQELTVRLIFIECTNCGFQRVFSTRAIRKWFASKKEKNDE